MLIEHSLQRIVWGKDALQYVIVKCSVYLGDYPINLPISLWQTQRQKLKSAVNGALLINERSLDMT